MNEPIVLSLVEIEQLALGALRAAGANDANAAPVAAAVAAAERDGISSHGLAYLATYCEHLRCGKVNGAAQPELFKPMPSLIIVDARRDLRIPLYRLA